ncbi:MAG: hypothetical protein PWP23_2671 [Candidatus Sumerlaeota bacterium]|nr:hypothetical protein [Candidatus Sumerlaeota bacterium]
MKTNIVMRSYNDAWVIGATLDAIARQKAPFELIVFDNESTDGSPDIIRKHTDRIVNVPSGTYVPGKVLNAAMRETDGEFVVFVNSDCTPQNDEWLGNLLAGFNAPNVAAVFGRQIPRPECQALFAKDTEDTFGDGARQKYWKHCFSMASSAIRRSAWEERPFNEAIQYSEDVEWTWQARQRGHEIRYVPDSIVMHSHNYTLKQWHKRQYGEGKAEAVMFDWPAWETTWLRYSLLPLGRQVLSDWKYALRTANPGAFLHSPALRTAQMLGRRKGFLEGLRERTS